MVPHRRLPDLREALNNSLTCVHVHVHVELREPTEATGREADHEKEPYDTSVQGGIANRTAGCASAYVWVGANLLPAPRWTCRTPQMS